MARSKEGKDSEFYLGQIRELKSENRNLKKQLRHLQKREHLVEEHELAEIIEEVVIKKQRCPDCSKGFLEDKEVLGRYWEQCNTCNYRTKVRK